MTIIHNFCAGPDGYWYTCYTPPGPHYQPPQTWGPPVNQPRDMPDGASAALGNHGNTPVSAHHNGYTKDVCVYIVHMLQPPKSTGLIADIQLCT